jgi:hypothetical protein
MIAACKVLTATLLTDTALVDINEDTILMTRGDITGIAPAGIGTAMIELDAQDIMYFTLTSRMCFRDGIIKMPFS